MFTFEKTINLDFTRNLIEDYIVVNICNTLVKNTTICPGIVKNVGKVFVESITHGILSPDYFCEEIAPTCELSGFDMSNHQEYIERVLSTKPRELQNNDYLNKLYTRVRAQNRKTIKTVHFSDPHVDNQYRVGADAYCNTYLCCREENGFPTEPER